MKIILPEGLSEKEASLRQEQWGFNELPQEKKDPFWKKSTQILKEPMILLLVAAATIYLFVGDIAEGLLLVLSVLVVVGISLYQERKSENALAARDFAVALIISATVFVAVSLWIFTRQRPSR